MDSIQFYEGPPHRATSDFGRLAGQDSCHVPNEHMNREVHPSTTAVTASEDILGHVEAGCPTASNSPLPGEIALTGSVDAGIPPVHCSYTYEQTPWYAGDFSVTNVSTALAPASSTSTPKEAIRNAWSVLRRGSPSSTSLSSQSNCATSSVGSLETSRGDDRHTEEGRVGRVINDGKTNNSVCPRRNHWADFSLVEPFTVDFDYEHVAESFDGGPGTSPERVRAGLLHATVKGNPSGNVFGISQEREPALDATEDWMAPFMTCTSR